MRISEVLRKTVDERLSGSDAITGEWPNQKFRFSCDAMHRSVEDYHDRKACYEFLEELGCDTESASLFSDIPRGSKRQMARALWLTFAAMIAEEEGK